jgi:hypothetical protein
MNYTKFGNFQIYYFFLIIGILVRFISLDTKGMEDVDVMINWGVSISSLGWDQGYLAIYFPTSHFIFNIIVELATLFNIEVFSLFSIVRLLSDVIFILLLIYLNNLGVVSRKIVLLIWLNPLLITLTLSGYTDTFSITLITACLVSLHLFQLKNTFFFGWQSGFLLAFFIFLKPQTLLLTSFLFFFLTLYILVYSKSFKLIKRIYILIPLFFPSVILFALYSVLLSSPTKLSCGDNIGPRTISSLEYQDLTEWNICLSPDQVGMSYPKSGPGVCVDNRFKAFAPLGDNGVCVKNYEFSSPMIVKDFGETGFNKLKNQIINGSAEHMPSYSANMPNIWHIYVLNFLDFDNSREVWFYKADEGFNKLVWLSVLLFTFIYTIIIFWKNQKELNSFFKLFSLIGFPITFIIPIFATLAHENHFALGLFFTYLILNLGLAKNFFSKLLHFLVIVISGALALNVSRLYLWPMWEESNNSILQAVGSFLGEVIIFPNIHQISLIVSVAALVFIVCIPLLQIPRTQSPNIK